MSEMAILRQLNENQGLVGFPGLRSHTVPTGFVLTEWSGCNNVRRRRLRAWGSYQSGARVTTPKYVGPTLSRPETTGQSHRLGPGRSIA